MKIFRRLLMIIVAAFIAYTAWTVMLTFGGYRIGGLASTQYCAEVLRMPSRFSYLTPLYRPTMFPGYVKMKILTPYGREVSSYSVNWDSFYPSKAEISISPDNVATFSMDGFVTRCVIGPSGVVWTNN